MKSQAGRSAVKSRARKSAVKPRVERPAERSAARARAEGPAVRSREGGPAVEPRGTWSGRSAARARGAWSAVRARVARARVARAAVRWRAVGGCAGAGLLVGALVLLAVVLRGEQHQGRVSLLAGPVPDAPQYGEVVALSLPALVEVARSPSVLARAGTAADRVSVELVPASGLARVSVRAPSAQQASREATAVAKAVVETDLLAPAAKLRVLDRAEVIRVAPDWPLALGLALAAAVVAAAAAAVAVRLRRTRVVDGVRAALSAAGVAHPVAVVRDDDPDVVARLAVLCAAATRPARVVAVAPDLVGRAEALAGRLPDGATGPGAGEALIAVAPAGRRQDGLASVVGALPAGTAVVAVVLV
ncbi:hypothetical protein [Saccharothrix algeriensis]|uniref:Capsular polysaccharide biosynthesis protein n=1 Tax=Saccharothrix algeriensis TaxID=173560 RepID=A0ABS2SDL9_9PSEU|nr:hypothetical protein [Saccharothrix algeriensis]MBM7814318.1 hypothetical protein [Saccharothrix algeriensis]